MNTHPSAEDRATKQALILEVLSKCGSLKKACKVAGVERKTVYHWQKTNATFRAAVEDANLEANDEIDDEIVRRAVEGIEEPLVSMGKLVFLEKPMMDDDGNPLFDDKGRARMQIIGQVKVKKYSDGLLLALAKSRMKKYRERTDLDLLDQINENTGGAITLHTRGMTSEELATLKQIGQAIKARTEEREKH